MFSSQATVTLGGVAREPHNDPQLARPASRATLQRGALGGDGERPWTVQEAADWLGVSRWTVSERVRLSEIPHRKRGRIVRLFEGELKAWLDGCELEVRVAQDGRVVRPRS